VAWSDKPLWISFKSGQMGGFAGRTDPLERNRERMTDELLSMPNVILTPHLAGSPRMNGIADFEEMIRDLGPSLSPVAKQP
jgi:phosphoglycerate dehydrogenase-like enzyme